MKDKHIPRGYDLQGISRLHRFWQHDATLLINDELHGWDNPTFFLILQPNIERIKADRRTTAPSSPRFFLYADLAPSYGIFVVDESLQRLFWWKGDPGPQRIAAQVMVYGNLEDIQKVRQLYGDSIFSEVLANPPSGVFDSKSWVFWHKKLIRSIIPRLPPQRVAWASG